VEVPKKTALKSKALQLSFKIPNIYFKHLYGLNKRSIMLLAVLKN
jgi:hypothetical protein